MFNISFQLGAFVHARTFLWSRRSEKPRFFAASRIPRVSRTWQNTPWRLWQWLTSPQSHLDGKRKGLSEELFFSSKDAMNPWICKTLLGEMSNAHFLKRVWVKGIMFVFELDFKWWFCFQRNVSKPLVLYRLFCGLASICSNHFIVETFSDSTWYKRPHPLLGTRDEAIFVSGGGGGDFESSRDQGLGRGRGMSNFSLYEKMIVYRLKVGNKSIL